MPTFNERVNAARLQISKQRAPFLDSPIPPPRNFLEGLIRGIPQITDSLGNVQEDEVQNVLSGTVEAAIPPGVLASALGGFKRIPQGQFGGPAFHGSPHRFDKFDINKIGTGEGAQVYGHGLYFAESPGVAKSYKSAGLGNLANKFDVDGEVVEATGATIERLKAASRGNLDRYIADSETFSRSYLERAAKATSPSERNELLGLAQQFADDVQQARALKGKKVSPFKGAFYEVDIPDEKIAQMLDWDKPLSEQPESVRSTLADLLNKHGIVEDGGELVDVYGRRYGDNGQGLYNAISQFDAGDAYTGVGRGSNDEAASAALREAGIPGIKYLDQASRGQGKGTRNLVLFSDEDIKILKINDKPVSFNEKVKNARK